MKEIQNDLLEQLNMKGMYQAFYIDMVNDYMKFYKMKKDLQSDIKKNGVRIEVTTGNGFTTSKINEAIREAQRVNAAMLKILVTLGLKTPTPTDENEDDYL